MQPSKNVFHAREVAAKQAELASARPYVFVPPDAPESTPPLRDIPVVGEARALLRRVRAAAGSNRMLGEWAGELALFVERYAELEGAERSQAAEVARAAAVKAVRTIATSFAAADDVAIATLADFPLNRLSVDGVECVLPKPICFVARTELAAFATAIEAKRQALAGRAEVCARDRRFAVVIEDWSSVASVLDAYDVGSAGHNAGETELDGFIAGIRDPRLLVRWAAEDAQLADALYRRAGELAATGGLSLRAAREQCRTLWPTTIETAPEMGGAA